MSESLGLSIGVANLVAARAGGAPVTRRSVLTLFDHRASEVGLPEENPNATEPGLVMRGFIQRVGDRAPLVATDGTKYLGDALTVEALEAMARTVGYGTPITIAVPAYWSEAQSAALREEFFAQPGLAPDGVPPVLISDATAALAALRAKPGFPTDGVVALCDFGAGGTTVTLINAGSNFRQIGPSVRYAEFSGDAIDQLILDHLRAAASDGTRADLASTTRIGSPTLLLDQCRHAKEQLSTATVTAVAAGSGQDVRLSRTKFEQLISAPLDRFASTVEEILQRNRIVRSNLAAVAIVGGGAGIPLLATRLSGRLQVPILTTPQPAYSAAIGAAVLGEQRPAAGIPGAASPVVENPTELVGTGGADMTQAVWAVQAGDEDRALAWSQDADNADEPVPYTGPDMTGEYSRETTGLDYADDDRYTAEAAELPWYKRTALVLSLVGAGAAVLVAVVLALTLGHTKSKPGNTTPPNQPAPPQTSQTATVIPAPPPSTPPPTSTTTPPPTTTTTTPPPTTTTTQPTTTSQVTTTTPSTPTRERPLRPRFEHPFRP
ncbi:MAG TPA: Hsp70 family protein [Mycobacterium sp.]|nr:Hsp70 family protein [Mycobacterium sp.]HUH71840.1 Hsp70 family protein [Mycobacterium sp.]